MKHFLNYVRPSGGRLSGFVVFVCILLTLNGIVRAQEPTPQQTTIRMNAYVYLGSVIGQNAVRSATLAPNGSLLVYQDNHAVCVFNVTAFVNGEQNLSPTCTPLPANFIGDPTTLWWGPNSAYVIFTENVFRNLSESDIWLFNATDGAIIDLTDDGVTGGFLDAQQPFTLDYTPVWNPASGDIYFFRSQRIPGGAATDLNMALYRLTPGGPSALVRDLTGELPTFSIGALDINLYLDGLATISPNGNGMAVVVRAGADNPQSGIWLIDLSGQNAPQQVSGQQFTLGLPSWQQNRLVVEGIAWSPDSASLHVIAANSLAQFPEISANVYRINFQTGETTPSLDFSQTATPDQLRQPLLTTPEGNFEPILVSPNSAAMNANRQRIILFSYDATTLGHGMLLMLDRSTRNLQAFILARLEQFTPNQIVPTNTSRMSTDGKLLIYGWLFLFEGI